MEGAMKYPVYRKLREGSSWYRIDGPAQWTEFQRIGSKGLQHEVVAMQHPEKMTLHDLLWDGERYAAVNRQDWESVTGEAEGGVPSPVEQADLAPLTTFGVPSRAAHLIEVDSDDAVRAALEWRPEGMPLLVLGGGSNMLLHTDWSGLVLRVTVPGIEVRSDDGRFVEVVAGAGERWHDFVMHTVEQGWGGLENLALIPGCVGAAPMQNIGAYGAEIKDHCTWVEAISIADGGRKRFPAAACGFDYRESVFKNEERDRWVITRVAFRLDRNAPLRTEYGAIQSELPADRDWTARDVAEAVIRIRQSKLPDPAILGNAGSFFKNPVLSAEDYAAFAAKHPEAPHYPQPDGTVKLAAGWLIERAGWKGHDRGTHGVHAQQALVLVNKGGATAGQIWQLAQDIRADVLSQFHVDLEPEVNQIGLR